MKNVLVTGANGHVGYNLASHLVESGYKVRASVRNLKDPKKTERLKKAGVHELVEGELLAPETMKAAVKGMDGVFQVAAVYKFYAKNPEEEIIRPTVEGNMNLLRAAQEEGVKKVVLTSTLGAVGMPLKGQPPYTEANWNDVAQMPYFQAKTKEERLAHEFAAEHKMNLVAVNPGVIIGPGFNQHTDSTFMVEMLLRGKVPMAFPMIFSYVDVRDVALAHRLAYENPNAKGRYCATGHQLSHLEACRMIGEMFNQYKMPTKNMPAPMLNLLPLIDWMGHKFQGLPRTFTQASVREFKGRDMNFDTSKIKKELGWEPRPLEETLRDTVEWILENFMGKAAA